MAGSTWPSCRAVATLTDIIAHVKKTMLLNEVDEHMRGKCHFKKAGGQSGQCSAETGAGAGMCLIWSPPLYMRNIYLSFCVKCRHNTVVIIYKISFSCKLDLQDLTNFQYILSILGNRDLNFKVVSKGHITYRFQRLKRTIIFCGDVLNTMNRF